MAGLALIPVFARSEVVSVARAAATPLAAMPHAVTLPRIDDPFARPIAADRPPTAHKTAQQKQPRKRAGLLLRATITGDVAYALVEESGTTKIVGVNEVVDGRKIVWIDDDAIVFAGGGRLTVASGP